MPPKKKNNQANAKSQENKNAKAPDKPRIQRHERHAELHFLAVLILFVGFSVYAISSFVTSNNNYIDQALTDVLRSTDDEVAVYEPEASYDNPFSDLDSSSPQAEAVIALYYEGIVGGYDDGTFKPGKNVTRAEFSKMLVEASDLDYTKFPPADLANCFTDVKDLPDHWFAPSVCASKYNGWVAGYAGGGFGPNNNINKAEALKIVLKAFDFEVPDNAGVSEMPYSDLKEGDWYIGVAYAAKENVLIPAAGVFDAASSMTRGEIVRIIYEAMRIKELL